MGISAGANKSGPKSDINVTPLVDVVLVLLIIFLVTMPVLMQHITIEIPRKLNQQEISLMTNITVIGKVGGTVALNDGSREYQIQRVELAKELRELILSKKADKTVFVDFEDNLPWGDVVSIMDTVKGVGDTSQEEGEVKIAIKTRDKTAPAPTP